MHILTGLIVALLILGSFVGWGRLVSCAVFRSSQGDWPFQAAWGLCVFTILGGLLNVFGCVSATVNSVILLTGIALLVFLPRNRDSREFFPRSRIDNVSIACLGLVSLITIILSLFPLIWEPQDDALAYASFPKKMLETGSLMEPFSCRRIVGFGGYQYLQTLAYPFLSHGALQLMDQGILSVLVGAALTCYTRKRLGLSWPMASLAGIVFLAHPPLRINLAPASIFSLLSLTFLESFELTSESRGVPSLKRAALLGLLAAGFLSLRANALAMAGSLFFLLVVTEQNQHGWRVTLSNRVLLLARAGLICGLLLLPWSLVLYRSSGTFFFPVMKGNYNTAITMSAPLSAVSYLRLVWKVSLFSDLHLLILLTVISLAVRGLQRSVICYGFAAIITSFAMISAFNLVDIQALYRYNSPFTSVAFILLIAAWMVPLSKWLSESPVRCHLDAFWMKVKQLLANRTVRWTAALAMGLAVLAGSSALFLKAAGGVDWKRERDWSKLSLERSLEGRAARSYVSVLANAETYQDALSTIPKGARVLVEVDGPFLLDFRDHDLCLIDDISVTAPLPGFPINGSSDELIGYLKSQSIDYVLYVSPDRPWRESMAGAYNRHWWDSVKEQNEPCIRLREPNYRWFFGALGEVSEHYQHLYDSNEAIVVSLRNPRSTAGDRTVPIHALGSFGLSATRPRSLARDPFSERCPMTFSQCISVRY